MPIDARIPLTVQGPPPVQPIDPVAAYGKMLSLRGMQTRQTADELQLSEAQKKIQRQEEIRKAYTVGGDGSFDEEATMSNLRKIGAWEQISAIEEAKQKQQEAALKARKDEADAQLAIINTHTAKSKRIAELFGAAKDQASLDLAITTAVHEGHLTQEDAAQMPRTWDETTAAEAKAFADQALGVAGTLEEARKAAEEKRKEAGFEVEQVTKQAQAVKAQNEAAAMGVPDNQEDWTAMYEAMDPALRKRLGVKPEYSEKARERLASTSMTGESKAKLQQSLDQFSETKRHNRAMEAKGEDGGGYIADQRRQAAEQRSVARTMKDKEGVLDARQSQLGRYMSVQDGDAFAYTNKAGNLVESKMTPELRRAIEQEQRGNEQQLLDLAVRKAQAVYGNNLKTLTGPDVLAWHRAVEQSIGRKVGPVELKRLALAQGYTID